MRNTTLLIALASLTFAGTAVAANPATGQFDVTASVQGSCRVSSASDLAFGVYDPADANATSDVEAQSSISVRCVKGMTGVSVALDDGQAASSCAAPARYMQDGGEQLSYGIYQDAAHSLVWGCDASNDKDLDPVAASNADIVLTTYGVIPAGQNVGLGANFKDTVKVTVSF